MLVGIDLDNTIINCHLLFHALAREKGWMDETVPCEKNAIREAVRSRHGERAWQELQALAYGPRLHEAALFPGVVETCLAWKEKGMELVIISHKTRASAWGAYPLRQAARDFLARPETCRLFPPDHVFFTDTRRDKVALIAHLQCGLFIDDLPEVLAEPEFPRSCRRVLFTPPPARGEENRSWTCCATWPAIASLVPCHP